MRSLVKRASSLQKVAQNPQWANLPANARYFFSLAAGAGLTIEHDGRVWTWTGTVEQHKASGVWSPKLDWSFKRRRSAWIPEGMEARLFRDSDNPEVIRAVLEDARPFSECGENPCIVRRFMARASGDTAYSKFMDHALAAVDVSGDEVPQPSAMPKSGPLREDLNRYEEFHDAISPGALDGIRNAAARLLVRASELDLKGVIIIAPCRNGKAVLCESAGLDSVEALGLLAQMSHRISANEERKLGEEGEGADEDA